MSKPHNHEIQNPKSEIDGRVLATTRGRPVTEDDLVGSLGVAPADVDAALRRLLLARHIRQVAFRGKTYYVIGS